MRHRYLLIPLVVLIVAAISGAVYAATSGNAANCSGTWSRGATTTTVSTTCQIPNPPVTTRTVTATATVTVTASPSATSSPTPTPTPSSTPTPTPSSTPSSTPSPTATSTPTPPPSGFPNASNTGVPAGTVLSPYTGPMVVTTDGTVIDSKTITGDLRIEAKNVLVENSKINGDVRIDSADSGFSFTVQDTTINAGDAAGDQAFDGTGIGERDFTALRVLITGGKRGVNCGDGCTLKDSYIHGQDVPGPTHQHESAVRMSENDTIVHNTLACDAPNDSVDGGCSADLTGYGDFEPVFNNLIQNNFFKAQTGGGTCAYGGASGGKPYSNASHDIRFVNNVFERGTNPSDHGTFICGYYATTMDFDESAPGNQFTGNTYDDGTPVLPNR